MASDAQQSHTFTTRSPCPPKSNIAIDIKVSSKSGINFTSRALLDTGSEFNICPAKILDRTLLTPVDYTLYGVSSAPVKALGFFTCRIAFDGGYLPNASFLVIDTDVPVLLGMEFLSHPSVKSFAVKKNTLELQRRLRQCEVTQHVPLCLVAVEAAKSAPPKLNTLTDKLRWLEETVSLHLPHGHNDKRELEEVADLLIDYSDVFQPCPGTFPVRVPIRTEPGKTVNVKQHPLPKQFHGELDAEIQKLLDKDVIEECANPRGWNSPIHAVRKKNGSVRIVANFKNTVNTVLSHDADKFQTMNMDTLFHDIGEGNKYYANMDMTSGYWHLLIDPSDRYKTSFQYKNKCFCFKRLPMGLKNSGDMFNRAAQHALADIKNKCNFAS